MDAVFGEAYSEAYDALYANKEYEAECDMIERAFRAYPGRPVRSILDLGCGTGNHAIPLGRRGYSVYGVDRSAAMLDRARLKAQAAGRGEVVFHEGDIRSITVGETFDAAIVMFNVLGYQTENNDVIATLRNVQRHLEPGGVVLADFWYAPAVISWPAQQRHKVVSRDGSEIIRLTDSEIDEARRLCRVQFRLWRLQNDRVLARASETHSVRFFCPDEIQFFFAAANMNLKRIGGFPNFEAAPGEHSNWTAVAIGLAENR